MEVGELGSREVGKVGRKEVAYSLRLRVSAVKLYFPLSRQKNK